jgi:Glycosyltransferase family 87
VAPRAVLLPAGLLAAAVVSLLATRTPATDPTAWLIWGREVAHGTLTTTGGPSWKPLPVAITSLLAPLGQEPAAAGWLVVSRFSGLAALVLAARVACRLGGGRAGGIAAAVLLALATDFLYDAGRGGSEGMVVALALGAVELLLRGRPEAGFAVGAGAALVRPEIAPLLVFAGVLLLRRPARRALTALLVSGAGAAVVALWLAPERIGSGDWLGAATRAELPAPDTPGASPFPFLMTLVSGATVLALPGWLGALQAVIDARRARPRRLEDRLVLALAAAAALVTLIVAGLAQVAFTGNNRYLLLPAALVCVVAGVGLPVLAARVRAARRSLVARATLVVAAASIAASAVPLAHRAARLVEYQRAYGHELPELIARAGGGDAVRRCGPVGASLLQRMAVAWRLRVRTDQVAAGIDPRVRTVIALSGTDAGRHAAPPVRLRLGPWVLRSACGPPARAGVAAAGG